MSFFPTDIEGAFVVSPPCFEDDRGFFSPIYEDRRFEENGLLCDFTRLNSSLSVYKGTIRGLHYQPPPHQETKLVRVIRGAIWDIALDLRKDSKTFGKWTGITLRAEERKLFYVPAGCAQRTRGQGPCSGRGQAPDLEPCPRAACRTVIC